MLTVHPLLERAMTEPAGGLRPLPETVTRLLTDLAAPPRLAAHLRAVHDVAFEVTNALAERFPALAFNASDVLFGAATHDIGKTVHPDELSGEGSAHERAGYELLLAQGIPEHQARFARTHAAWDDPVSAAGLEDLLVSVADKVWKGKRVGGLEQLVVAHICTASGLAPWEAFMALDDILGRIAEGADDRLAFQARYPVNRY